MTIEFKSSSLYSRGNRLSTDLCGIVKVTEFEFRNAMHPAQYGRRPGISKFICKRKPTRFSDLQES
jgi:hypothetical protein